MGSWSAEHGVHFVIEPAADFIFVIIVNVGVGVHGDLDRGVPELRLNVLEVEFAGAFHTAGHVVAQHVEGRADAEGLPRFTVLRGKTAGVDVVAIFPGEDEFGMQPGGGGEAQRGLHRFVGSKFPAKFLRQAEAALAFGRFGRCEDQRLRLHAGLFFAEDQVVGDFKPAFVEVDGGPVQGEELGPAHAGHEFDEQDPAPAVKRGFGIEETLAGFGGRPGKFLFGRLWREFEVVSRVVLEEMRFDGPLHGGLDDGAKILGRAVVRADVAVDDVLQVNAAQLGQAEAADVLFADVEHAAVAFLGVFPDLDEGIGRIPLVEPFADGHFISVEAGRMRIFFLQVMKLQESFPFGAGPPFPALATAAFFVIAKGNLCEPAFFRFIKKDAAFFVGAAAGGIPFLLLVILGHFRHSFSV